MRSSRSPFTRLPYVWFCRWDRSTRRAIERKSEFEKVLAVTIGGPLLGLMSPELSDVTRDVLLGTPPWQVQVILVPLLAASWALYFLVRRVRNLNRFSMMR